MELNKLTSWRLTVFLSSEVRNSDRNTIYLGSKALVNHWKAE